MSHQSGCTPASFRHLPSASSASWFSCVLLFRSFSGTVRVPTLPATPFLRQMVSNPWGWRGHMMALFKGAWQAADDGLGRRAAGE